MDFLQIALVVFGLILFETINSVDNAVVNADVLSTMSEKSRRWFLIWGLLIAVFLIRGLLPWIIIWVSVPNIGPWGAFLSSFSNDPIVHESIEIAAPNLLIAGGTFLIFLFLHWLFIEPKSYGLYGESFFHKRSSWFYAAASLVLLGLAFGAHKYNAGLVLGSLVGSSMFFVTNGFKEDAAQKERSMIEGHNSDISKLLYLEVLDASFSIDSVLGAFAFTLSVPLILIGNGIGSLVLRELTIRNIQTVKKYTYLKNGAMYSILGLGIIMISDSFGAHIPHWLSPVLTFGIIIYFLLKSIQKNREIEGLS